MLLTRSAVRDSVHRAFDGKDVIVYEGRPKVRSPNPFLAILIRSLGALEGDGAIQHVVGEALGLSGALHELKRAGALAERARRRQGAAREREVSVGAVEEAGRERVLVHGDVERRGRVPLLAERDHRHEGEAGVTVHDAVH